MSPEFTADQLDIAYHEAAAEAVRTKTEANRRVSKFTVARHLWILSRKLKPLLDAYERATHLPNVAGLTLQRVEKDLVWLTQVLDRIEEICKAKHFNEDKFIRSSYFEILRRNEALKDYWVAFSSSTDADLAEKLKAAESEESVSWDTLWR